MRKRITARFHFAPNIAALSNVMRNGGQTSSLVQGRSENQGEKSKVNRSHNSVLLFCGGSKAFEFVSDDGDDSVLLPALSL